MIYIIDDKPERQRSLAPDLGKHKSIILIHKYDGELEVRRREVFQNAKVIAIHDSFFKNPLNKHPNKSEEIILKDLKEYCHRNKIRLVFFSGDYLGYSEKSDKLECQVGVTRFYKNLVHFVTEMEQEKELVLQILGFGKDYKIESVLSIYTDLIKKIETNDISQARILLSDICVQLKIGNCKNIENLLIDNKTPELINMIDPFILAYYENISN